MSFNITAVKSSSNGAWQGDNPLDFAFPLLIVQTALIIAVSRSLALLFRPLRQPKVIAEIVGGILLGPSAFGRNTAYMNRIFPSWSMPILESVASIGLLFFLFLVGLELDLSSIRRSGKRAFGIALSGITLPFVGGVGVAFLLRKIAYDAEEKPGYGEFLVFMGVALSITAFPVLARILAELKLLMTRVGETAMAAAAFNDLAAWILLALAVALAGNGGEGQHKSPLVSLWVLLSGVAFVVFMMVLVRPLMKRVARCCSPENDVVHEAYVCSTLAGVMISGFITDLIGIHSIFGAFVFGLTIPKEGEFAEHLIKRIEDFVTGLLLPLYFASSGLKTNVAKIHGGESWGLLGLVITTACLGKIAGTFAVAIAVRVPAREALALGFLMNTKGLVELIVLNIGKEKKVLNDETFALLVLMALFTTFITTPCVMAIYKPARKAPTRTHRRLGDMSEAEGSAKEELRILACLHGPSNVSSLIALIESIRTTKIMKMKLFVMHMMELTERSSAIRTVQRARRNGLPFVNRFRNGEWHDNVVGSFEAYRQLGRVAVRPMIAISPLQTMHEDICHVAETKRVTIVILPFHKRWNTDGNGNGVMENVGHAWRVVNQRVLKHAPCSVAVLVDRGLGSITNENHVAQRVCVMFLGGPDDREALELGGRMAEHPAVKVTVIRYLEKEGLKSNAVMLRPAPSKNKEKSYAFSMVNVDHDKEKELDEEALEGFKTKWEDIIEYTEKESSNIIEETLSVGQSGDYGLIVVGRGRFPSTIVVGLADRVAEHPELGPIGDVLASSDRRIISSVLIVQQHNLTPIEETPLSKISGRDISNECSQGINRQNTI